MCRIIVAPTLSLTSLFRLNNSLNAVLITIRLLPMFTSRSSLNKQTRSVAQ